MLTCFGLDLDLTSGQNQVRGERGVEGVRASEGPAGVALAPPESLEKLKEIFRELRFVCWQEERCRTTSFGV